MLPARPFYMIRHGQSVANANKFMAGSYDSPLTALGWEQAEEVRKVFDKLSVKPSVIIHSHLTRARNTAVVINKSLGLPMHETPDIAEHHVGDWEKMPWEDIRPLLDQDINPPNGESHAEFRARVCTTLTHILTHHDTPPLIVCHGGIFRGMGDLYGQQWHPILNCILYEFTPADGNIPWQIHRHDEQGKYIAEFTTSHEP